MAEKKKTAGETAKSEVEVFTFNPSNQQIRVETIGGEPWFVAKDVCQALGIENNRNAVARLDDDEKGVSVVRTPSGDQQMSIVNESGLYNLIFQSRKPEAKVFRKWVTGEVLPSIRKTGRYSMAVAHPIEREFGRRMPMRRGEGVNAETLRLLWLIGECLWHGDQKAVAMQLGVSVQAVSNVLNGSQRSHRILGALYRKALERQEQNLLYSDPSGMAERLLGAGTASAPLLARSQKKGGAR